MTDFQPGDTVRFRIDEPAEGPEKVGWYTGVLSTGSLPAGWLRIDGDDFTEHPEGYRPTGWLVIRDGEPYSHLIKDLTLVHRPEQEGTIMPTLSFPLREGDRVRYTIDGDHRLSGPLRPSTILGMCSRLIDTDPDGTYITTEDHGTLAPAIEACDLVERHGLPVEVHEIQGRGVCIIYTTLQDRDGMYYMHIPDRGTGSQNVPGLTRCGVPESHPITSDTLAWGWVTPSELDEAGVAYSQWPTPLRYGNDQQTGDKDVDEVADALQAQVAELEEFKRRVARVAMEYGRRHNMCRVVRDGLRELGIAPADEQEVTITFTMKVKATPPDTADANVTADDVQRALTWDGWDAVKVREKIGLRLTGWKVGDVTLADPVVTDVHPVIIEELPF